MKVPSDCKQLSKYLRNRGIATSVTDVLEGTYKNTDSGLGGNDDVFTCRYLIHTSFVICVTLLIPVLIALFCNILNDNLHE